MTTVGEVLTGVAISVTDFGRVRPGDLVTIVVDGWQAEQLTLTAIQLKPPLDHYTRQAWIYGTDVSGRVRLVLARYAPQQAVGRAAVPRTE